MKVFSLGFAICAALAATSELTEAKAAICETGSGFADSYAPTVSAEASAGSETTQVANANSVAGRGATQTAASSGGAGGVAASSSTAASDATQVASSTGSSSDSYDTPATSSASQTDDSTTPTDASTKGDDTDVAVGDESAGSSEGDGGETSSGSDASSSGEAASSTGVPAKGTTDVGSSNEDASSVDSASSDGGVKHGSDVAGSSNKTGQEGVDSSAEGSNASGGSDAEQYSSGEGAEASTPPPGASASGSSTEATPAQTSASSSTDSTPTQSFTEASASSAGSTAAQSSASSTGSTPAQSSTDASASSTDSTPAQSSTDASISGSQSSTASSDSTPVQYSTAASASSTDSTPAQSSTDASASSTPVQSSVSASGSAAYSPTQTSTSGSSADSISTQGSASASSSFKASTASSTASSASTATSTSASASSSSSSSSSLSSFTKVTHLGVRVQGDMPAWNEENQRFVSAYYDTFDEKYRAVLDTVNMASVEGALKYVQAECINASAVTGCERKNDIKYVVFYQVTVAQPAAAMDHYVNATDEYDFAVEHCPFMAMDGGQCDPNSDGSFPDVCNQYIGADGQPDLGFCVGGTLQDNEAIAPYPHNYWFSFPNSCPQELWDDKTDSCREEYAGGMCAVGVEPDGVTCTYSYEILGYILLDDVVGITSMLNPLTGATYADYYEFCEAGGIEFSVSIGVSTVTSLLSGLVGSVVSLVEGLDFWANPGDSDANAERVEKLVSAYDELVSANATTSDGGLMRALPTVDALSALNPSCYENSPLCAQAEFGCKRSYRSQICQVCTSDDSGCEKP